MGLGVPTGLSAETTTTKAVGRERAVSPRASTRGALRRRARRSANATNQPLNELHQRAGQRNGTLITHILVSFQSIVSLSCPEAQRDHECRDVSLGAPELG